MTSQPANGTVYVHPTAIVEPSADVGEGTKVWHHAHVRDGSVVGQNCVLGKNVFIDAGAVVGNGCKIQNNVSVYHGVTISDDVFVGPAATFTNDLVPRAFNANWKVSATNVGKGASIGANATIVCGTTLGEYCMVAAGATVSRDVAPHQLVVGIPAQHRGWVCRCGQVVSRELAAPERFTCDSCRAKEVS